MPAIHSQSGSADKPVVADDSDRIGRGYGGPAEPAAPPPQPGDPGGSDSVMDTPEGPVTADERLEALDALKKAEVLEPNASEPATELLIRAYRAHGDVPSRIIGAGQGNAPLPDLSATEDGLAALDRFDQFVRDRLSGGEPTSPEDA